MAEHSPTAVARRRRPAAGLPRHRPPAWKTGREHESTSSFYGRKALFQTQESPPFGEVLLSQGRKAWTKGTVVEPERLPFVEVLLPFSFTCMISIWRVCSLQSGSPSKASSIPSCGRHRR